MQMNLEAVKRAQVSVRFIALKECPDGFGSHVTYATNFQNSVDSRDFIALDPEQMRLRKEFKLDLGKEYTLRRGDSPPGASAGCSVIDAVIALACANSDVRFAVMTKNQIAELWKSTETSPYRDLFNPGTSAVEVWRRVRVMRKIDAAMQSSRAQEEGLAKEVALKCDRIVAHLVIRLMNNEGIDNPDIEWEVNLKTVEPLATKVLRGLTESVNAELGERGSVERMTKNVTKCRKLVEQVLDNFDADAELPDETNTKLAELRDGIRGPEFWLRRPGISARGYRFGQKKFLVLKDSIAASTGTPSLYPRYSRRRSQLIDELTLRPTTEGTQLVLAQDELFDSPSDAGAVIAGCIINGPKEWRTVEGIPLTQFEKEEEGASDTTGSA